MIGQAERPSDWQGLPVASFASVMGFCSAGLLWRLAGQVLHSPGWIGEPIIGIGIILFFILLLSYSAKPVRCFNAVCNELDSSATSCHFGCISIALLLISAAVLPYSNTIAIVIWSIGAFAQMIIYLYVMGRWIGNETPLAHASPAWLIPIVGNAVASFTGAPLGFQELSWALFSVGLVGWMAVMPILLNRLIFHSELPNSAMPSLAMFVSSPAVIALGWGALVPDGGIGFRFFMFSALFFALLLFRLGGSLVRTKFSVAWWAYTFPSCALANSLLRYSEIVKSPWTTALAWLGLVIASSVLLLVAGSSVKAIFVAGSSSRTSKIKSIPLSRSTETVTAMKRISVRHLVGWVMQPSIIALLAAAIAFFAIAIAWAFQWVGYDPCEICLTERIPYYVGIPVALITAALQGRGNLGRLAYVSLILTFGVSAAIGFYHAGLEWHFWAGPATCTGNSFGAAPIGNLLQQLDKVTIAQCDVVALRVLGLSLAVWNMIVSVALIGLAIVGLISRTNKAGVSPVS